MEALPTGTVTFLFTDIEGSTRLLQILGDDWGAVREEHNRLLRQAIRQAHGIDLSTEGDSFFAVFSSAVDAVSAATAAQRALAASPWPQATSVRVRMGVHTGRGVRGGDGYVGLDVHRAARIAAAGHGGQVLVSASTRALVEHELPEGVSLRDLGPHRLKDIEHAEGLHQLIIDGLPAEFPPVRASGKRPTNLPPERSSFVGRTQEAAEIAALLTGTRLLTLTGPGGTGKTRLALQVAAGEHPGRFADGVYWVDLSQVSDPELVAPAIATVLRVREVAGQSVLESVAEHIRERELLLLLDNFEQVVDGAPAVGVLLDAAPALRVLVTSRVPLYLRGEQEYPVPPLALPDAGRGVEPGTLARNEAVALFMQRAAAVRPSFELTAENAPVVAEICARVDGLPLAIELAASRIKVLTPEALLARLEHRLPLLIGGSLDRPERHRTLRAAIEWGHDLLGPAERRLFARLAVFSGGWTVESAEIVCGLGNAGAPLDPAGVLDGLSSLVDRSLVRRSDTPDHEVRFDMLGTIREFAAERLSESGEEDDIRRRHAEHFRDLAEQAEPLLRGKGQTQWLRRLEIENDNFRGALRWAETAGDVDTGVRTAAGIWRFWQRQGHLAEGRATVERLLAMPGARGRDTLRAGALATLGNIAYWQNDYPAMASAYEESLAISREIGDPSLIARGVRNVSFVPLVTGDLDRAEELKLQAYAAAVKVGDPPLVAEAAQGLGIIQLLRGDAGGAIAPFEEAIALHREGGNRMSAGEALLGLAAARHQTGDERSARALVRESLLIQLEVGNSMGLVTALAMEAAVASIGGQHQRAARLMGASARLREQQGGGAPPFLLALFGDPDGDTRLALGDEEYELARAEGYAMDLDHAVALATENA